MWVDKIYQSHNLILKIYKKIKNKKYFEKVKMIGYITMHSSIIKDT